MRKHAYSLLFFILLCTRASVFSQTIAVTHTTGCAPLVQDSFTGIIGNTGVLWNFGDGTSANTVNAVHTYASPGTYNVVYTANGGINQTLTVVVHGKPTPNFTATPPTKGCIPLPVTFHDNSTGGGGSAIVNWQWAYGDGGINLTNSANQTYTYTVGGQFSVTIKVTDANGCDSSLTIPNLINVSQKPTVLLNTTPNPPSACLPPLTVTFTSTGSTSHSTTSPTLTYQWNFTPSGTSTLSVPPPRTYTAAGTYPVKLIVTDNNNCSDSATVNVGIKNPHAAFATNDTICMIDTFINSSTGASVYLWNYGDGTPATTITSHTYTAPGHYTITLTAFNGSCQDDTSIAVYVEQPVANFSVTPTYMCSLPKVVTVNNMSTPMSGSTFQWYCYDAYTQYQYNPSASTSANPTFTITNLDTNRYSIYSLHDNDSITLTVTTARGCKAHMKYVMPDTFFITTARLMVDKYQGCVPLTVNFFDSSHSREPIVSYEYIFGDGSAPVTGNPDPTHTYTSTGVYYPKLIIHNSAGCFDTSYTIKIEVGRPPTPNFSVTPTNICIGDPVSFTDLTPASDSVDSWHFYSDGGSFASACYGSPNSSWPFTHATGPQDVTLEACFRGCCASSTQTGAVFVKGPLVSFTVQMDCSTPMTYSFTSTLDDVTGWMWDMGDGNTVAASDPVYTYTAEGNYWVVLTGQNSTTGCNDYKDSMLVHVRNVKADFLFDTLQCSGTSHVFNSSPSHGVYTYGNNGYIWLWGDNTHPDITASTTTSHSFSAGGVYTVTLIVKDQNECPDTIRKTIRAYSAVASFTTQNTMCANDTLLFTSTSVADTTITGYSWVFGDGALSTASNPSHIFNITNGTIIKDTAYLTITTALGCVSTVKKIITISRPNANFSLVSIPNICVGDSVKFNYNNPNGNPGLLWVFGDGAISNNGTAQPAHQYTVAGTYNVILTVTDSVGCKDTKSNAVVNVQNYPVAYISSPAFHTPNLCYPYQATFTDSSINANPANPPRSWDLGTGQTITPTANVGTIYSTPGTYTITLVEMTSNGCKDSTKKVITVLGPAADFTLTPTTICKGQDITFTIKDTTDVFTWHWDFGDGKDTNAFSPVTHKFNFHPPGGSTNVTLVYWSNDSSCVQTKVYPVNIYQVISDFDRNHEQPPLITKGDTAHCMNIADHFYNTSIGDDTRGWVFSDGFTSTAPDSITHTFAAPGTYSVELFIKNNTTGCVDTLVKKMIIFPPLNITATGDSICQGSSGQIAVVGGTTFDWEMPAGLNDNTIANPTANPSVTTTYTVVASDINGCTDTATAFVYVQLPPAGDDDTVTIVIGQTASYSPNAGIGFTYTWTPSTDLSCTTCSNPTSSSTVDIIYTVTVSDKMGCFSKDYVFDVHVLPLASIDVPSAFTPNGDGTNDIVYVAGWGIKELQYFKIFNRWGELLFESNDLKVGWDGTYRGVPQNTETYIYEASALPYIDSKPLFKKGTIKLLR
ncbi:MAG: PKD domain-containing protein [Bacteroidia bacterium]